MSKLLKAGNSLAVTIPSKFVRQVGARRGDQVKLELKPQTGQIIITFKNLRQLPLISK